SLQDIRINERSVVLHNPTTFSVERLGDVADLENVLEGTISDDICSMTDQCAHGSCQNTFNDFECHCQKGYFGRRCERKDHCLDSPCPAGGECENVGDGYICLPETAQLPSRIRSVTLEFGAVDGPSFDGCLKDVTVGDLPRLSFYKEDEFGQPNNVTFWAVDKRVKVATSCLSSQQCGEASPCIRGECHDLWNAYACECPRGFEGTHCEVKRDECSKTECGRGQCVEGVEGARCRCDSGFTGEACDVEMDLCSLIPCKNGGLCTSSNGSYTCECKSGWTGKSCDIRVILAKPARCFPICAPHPPAVVEDIVRLYGMRRCALVTRYQSDEVKNGFQVIAVNCKALALHIHVKEIRIDYCKRNPCLNGGSCESLVGEHKCHCINGFTGANCETDIDECLFGFCANGAKCRDRIADYECICDGTGFSGFIGSRCTVRNPCQPDSFNRTTHTCVHGMCINPAVKVDSAGRETAMHECKCSRGYTGSQCTTQVSERKILGVSYILGPMAAVLTVLTILGCVLLAFVLRGKRALHGHYSPSHQERNGARVQMNSMVKLPPEERLI
ncbi:EGF-like domain protein, partial [Teladorsagia circumcincta]